ncbi:restriction endonuclease subunit S [Brucella sp. 21LCYQ03]|nr:restriction endonuclease subunit S [Brucella sp. 21LCYQ03]
MQFKPYPEYKDSGVEWLGDVPAHWGVARLKYYAESNPSVVKTKINLNENIEFIPMSNIDEIIGIVERFDYRKLEEVSVGYTSFNNGDVIFAKITPCMENGNCALVDGMNFGFGYGSTEFIVFRARSGFEKEFLYHFLRREDLRNIAANFMTGTAGQQRISTKFLDDFPASKPSRADQKSIVSFLNDETAKIDNLIAKQEKLIELLEEQRKTVITHAVTKGLDPDAQMKNSGVEWLGEVPAHWSIVMNRHVFDYSKGLTITKDDLRKEGVACINYGEIHSRLSFGFEFDINKLLFVSDDYLINYRDCLVSHGDFVFADTSEDLLGAGNFTYMNNSKSVFAGYHTIICKLKEKSVSRFFAYYFESEGHRCQIREEVKGIKVYSITQGILKRLYSVIPPTDEMRNIVSYLDAETAKIDQAISKQKNLIVKLQEYRSSVISHAVTGKIDVRDIAA